MIISISTVAFNDYEKALELRKDVIHPVVKNAPGCKFCQFAKATDGSEECVVLIGWETQEDHDNWFNGCVAHDILKENQWPLMEENNKMINRNYELILD